MKVLHLVPALEQGGVETVICDINRVAAAGGWENVVVSSGGRLVARIEADGGRHLTLDVKSKNPLTYFTRAARLRRILQAERPDLVCAHSRVPAWLFVWANRKLGLRWITYAHGANSVSRYSEVMTRGDLTVTPSRFLADYLKRSYGLSEDRIRVINPAVDSRRFDPSALDLDFVADRRKAWGIAPDMFVAMAVGRITPIKGYDTLIRAVPRLRAAIPCFRLVIVGDAEPKHREYAQSLATLAAELGVTEHMVFAGGEAKVPECLSLASVVVSANTRKPETFGLSMAEALMMGRPVVAKAFGGALDIVQDGVSGVLVRADATDDVAAFADAIAKVHGSHFGDLRKDACRRFDAAAMASRTRAVYDEVLHA